MTVAGRDIHLSGVQFTPEAGDRLINDLSRVRGVAIVISKLQPLPPPVGPLTFSAVGVLATGATAELRRQRADALVARLNQFNYLGFVLGGVLTGLVSSAASLRWGYVVPLVLTAVLITLAPAFAPGRRSPSDSRPASSR